MSFTEATMLPLGSEAPPFALPDTVSGNTIRLQDIASDKATVVMFICNHCPYVIHVNEELVRLANEYIAKGIAFVAISSNDVINYPQDGPDKMKENAAQVKYPFQYLYDESQNVARAFDAACTPGLFIFCKKIKASFRGRLCVLKPHNSIPLKGKDMRESLEALLGRQPVTGERGSRGGGGF